MSAEEIPTEDAVERHPLNDRFDWSVLSGELRLVSPDQLASWDRDGFFLLEDALDRDTVERVIREIDPHEAKVEAFLRAQKEGRYSIARAGEISFTTHLVTRSAYLAELVQSRLFQDLTHDLLGPEVRLYWDQAVYKKPGTRMPFPWHQDNGYNFVEPQSYLTCWIALTDATLENGCPWVLPGLHRRGTLRHWRTDLGFQCVRDPETEHAVPAPAGSIVVFSSLTPHATGPNLTDGVRKAYIVQYAAAGARRVAVDPGTGQRTHTPQDDPQRQFRIPIAKSRLAQLRYGG